MRPTRSAVKLCHQVLLGYAKRHTDPPGLSIGLHSNLAATVLHHDLTVLTFNLRHLERVAGLKIYRSG